MSYILDALRRADAERERGTVPGIHAQPIYRPLMCRKCAPGVSLPRLPPNAIAPVLETAGRNAIKMQKVGRIALAARTAVYVAPMQPAIGFQFIRRDDAPAAQSFAELVDRVTHISRLANRARPASAQHRQRMLGRSCRD